MDAIPDAVTRAWQAAVDAWDDPKRHDALTAVVAQYSCFAWAAARYRERAGDPVADRQLERLRRAATATMLATATVRPDRTASPYRASMLLLVVLLVVLGIGLVYAVVRENRPTTTTTPARP